MIFDTIVADADLFGNFGIGHAFQPVHQEDAAGLSRHCQKRSSIDSPNIALLHPPRLFGGDRCIQPFINRPSDDWRRRPPARTVNEKITRASDEIGLRILYIRCQNALMTAR
jgi:hypothetical protein